MTKKEIKGRDLNKGQIVELEGRLWKVLCESKPTTTDTYGRKLFVNALILKMTKKGDRCMSQLVPGNEIPIPHDGFRVID